ncbi:MAG: YihY/virulence factor BrkB family protein [Rhodanobacteraceae bacterium]
MRQDAGPVVQALQPWKIPLHGWLHIARRIGHETLRDHVFITSSGVAFLALFALLPTLTAMVSVYALVTSPEQLSQQLQSLSSVAPSSMISGLRGALHEIVRGSGLKLGFGLVLSIAAAVWVAVRAVLGIIGALNIVHGVEEQRSVPALFGTALALALGALCFWVLALVLIAGAPLAMRAIAPGSTVLYTFVRAARWVVIAAAALVSMAVLYRFGPCDEEPRWEWWSPGSFVATGLWLAVSAGMSVYVSHAGLAGGAYGSIGMVVTVMTWFFMTAFMFLLGAEFNVELARERGVGARPPSR